MVVAESREREISYFSEQEVIDLINFNPSYHMEVTASSNLIVAKHFLVPSPMLSAEYIDNLEGSEKILLVSHSKMG